MRNAWYHAIEDSPCIAYRAIAVHDDAVELLANAYLLDVAVHSYESYQGCSKQVLVACWERVNMIGAIRSLSLLYLSLHVSCGGRLSKL